MAAHQAIQDEARPGAHRVTFSPKGATLVCPPGMAILDASMAAGYFPRHSCRRGQCQACAYRLLSGSVRYPNGFETASLPPGHCLTCIAIPECDVVIDAPDISAEPRRRTSQFGARVVSNTRVASDVAVLRLQAPAAAEFHFAAGQYVDVILRDGSRRSYSMANAPDDSGVIEWHVRAMPGGRFSCHAYEALKARDLLRIEGPFGNFHLSSSRLPVILLASGTGYAPIAAILKSHGAELAARGGYLYWGARRREDIYAWEEAQALCARFGNVHFVPVLSDPAGDWLGRSGLVHEAVLQDFQDLSGHEVYACGNPLMVDSARAAFVRERGLPATAFFSDAFVTGLTVRQGDS